MVQGGLQINRPEGEKRYAASLHGGDSYDARATPRTVAVPLFTCIGQEIEGLHHLHRQDFGLAVVAGDEHRPSLILGALRPEKVLRDAAPE